MKTDERRRARELRAAGQSIKEIERLLGVSRSSVSRWVRDVPLSAEQRRILVTRTRKGPLVPASSLRKSVVNVYSKYSLKKRANKLPYGTCKLVVHSTRIVQTIYGSIQEYGGFDRPEWLD
jgi:transposase